MTTNTTMMTSRYRLICPFILTNRMSMIIRHDRLSKHGSMHIHIMRNRSNIIHTQFRHGRSQKKINTQEFNLLRVYQALILIEN